MSRWTSGLIALMMGANAHALQTGDVAFTAFNADEDGWALVALAEIAPGSTLFFTENAWDGGAGSFSGGEAYYTWTLGADALAAGSVVRFAAINSSGRSASSGSLSAVQNANLGVTGETLFAYLGSSATQPGTFLAAISTEGFVGGQLSGTGLVAGQSALELLAGADFGEYAGPRSGLASFAQYATLLNDPARWDAAASGGFATRSPDLTAFTVISAVPEPQTYAMMLCGLGLIASLLRRGAAANRVV